MSTHPTPLHEDMDAQRWAKEFMQILDAHHNIEVDEGFMLGWFANAIMCGYDTANRRGDAEIASLKVRRDETGAKLSAEVLQNDDLWIENGKLKAQVEMMEEALKDIATHEYYGCEGHNGYESQDCALGALAKLREMRGEK